MRLPDRTAAENAISWKSPPCEERRAAEPQQKVNFRKHHQESHVVHEQLTKFYYGFRRDAHPMAVDDRRRRRVSAFYHDAMDFRKPSTKRHFNRLVAKMPDHRGDGVQVKHRRADMYPDNE
jgi:citrate synthase